MSHLFRTGDLVAVAFGPYVQCEDNVGTNPESSNNSLASQSFDASPRAVAPTLRNQKVGSSDKNQDGQLGPVIP